MKIKSFPSKCGLIYIDGQIILAPGRRGSYLVLVTSAKKDKVEVSLLIEEMKIYVHCADCFIFATCKPDQLYELSYWLIN